jgi:hypothetical protein
MQALDYSSGIGLTPAQETRKFSLRKMDQSSDIYNYQLSGICHGCMVLAAQATISDRNGLSTNIGSGVYTHHIIMTDRNRKPVPNPVAMKCGQFTVNGNMPMGNVSVFLGKGDELDGKVFAAKGEAVKSGFHIDKTDRINFAAEVVNYNDFDKDVYLRLEYEYITGRPSGYLDIGMGAINIGECGQSLKSLGECIQLTRDRSSTDIDT